MVGGTSTTPFLADMGLPPSMARGISRMTPILETGLGLLLILGIAARVTHFLALLSGATFVVLQWKGRTGHANRPCHCFGEFDRGHSWTVGFVRAVAFATLCVGFTGLILVSPTNRETAWAASAMGAIMGIAMILIFALLDEVAGFEMRRPRAVRLGTSGNADPSTPWRTRVRSIRS